MTKEHIMVAIKKDNMNCVLRDTQRTTARDPQPGADGTEDATERLVSWARADKTGQKRTRPDTKKGSKSPFHPHLRYQLSLKRRPRPGHRVGRKARRGRKLAAGAGATTKMIIKGISDKKSRVLSDSRRTSDVYSQLL